LRAHQDQLQSIASRPSLLIVLSFLQLTILQFTSLAWAEDEAADLVVVKKSVSQLYLFKADKVLATFDVAFGGNPRGHKESEGDSRTPEGSYVLDYKNAQSRYYKSIHISYPNARDVEVAKARGLRPGGAIMVHGQPNGWGWFAPIMQLFDWTDGCIALRNGDMDAVWRAVDVGTPIRIEP
jgi:murein L,D-transpeptidase YafK